MNLNTEAWGVITGILNLSGTVGFGIAMFGAAYWVYTARKGHPQWGPFMFGVSLVILGFLMPIVLRMMMTIIGVAGEGKKAPAKEPTPKPTQTPEASPGTRFDATPILTVLLVIGAVLVVLAIAYFLGTRIIGDLAQKRADAAKRVERDGRRQALWSKIVTEHEAIKSKLLRAETDWDSLFRLPALVDATVPETAKMYRALAAADAADSTMPDSFDEDSSISSFEYPKLVRALAAAWRAAERRATVIGQSLLPAEERKTIQQIRDLLAIAENGSAASTERQLAYRRVQSLVDTLRHVAVPERALAELEKKKQLALAA